MRTSLCLILSLFFTSFACLKAKNDAGDPSAAASEPKLAKLVLNIDALNPPFDPLVKQYTIASPETTANKMTINTAPIDEDIKIQINGVDLRSDFTTDALPLVAGKNEFAIDLLNSAGTKLNTYTVAITRAQELQDQEIDGLATSEGDPTPAFSNDIVNYAITIGKDTTIFTVSPLARYPELATIVVNGKSYPGYYGSYDVDVNVGTTTITMEIRGESGRTKTYTLVVTRPAS